jgi:hypothetical protein
MKLFNIKFFGAVLTALTLFGLLAMVFPGEAAAHGRRDLVNGKYQIIFGFLAEPAYSGQQNGIDLTVCEGACVNNPDGTLKNPVKDVQKTLKAEVSYGGQTRPVELAPRFRADGKYNGYFFPTKEGAYTFRFFGTINGDAIDERVTSGKDGFNEVQNAEAAQFPTVTSVDQQIKAAEDKASTATTFGIIGIVVGALGLAVGVFSLLRRPTVVRAETKDAIETGSFRSSQGG